MKFDILHKKKAQAGYTMFETIGALGLLSLLLIGSIRGIQYSSDRLHANELNNEIMQRAADIKMQLDRPHAKVKWSKWEAKSHTGCPIEFSQNTEEVTIQVLNIKQRVCEMVLSDLSHLEGASRVEGACQSSANNTLIFYFDKLGTKKRIKGEDCFCDDPKVCDENGDCVCPEDSPIGYEADTCTCPDYLMPIRGRCLCEDETEPIDGKCGNCSTDEDCDGELTCENHTCTCIDKECSESDFIDTLCACCPVETPKWDETEGACKTCADIDINLPVYNKETKTCEACPDNKVWDGVSGQCVECVVDTDCADSGFVCTNNVCECAEGTSTPCLSNLIQTTNTSKYNQICYLCSCPTGSTMSGDTCVCNNECQTYDVTTKMCTNKADGTVCTNGVCSGGMCINDTCPSGTQKLCAADLVATQTAQTASGTWCYTCGCPTGSTLSSDGTTCICDSECQTYDTSTKSCVNKTEGTVCSDGLCKNGSCLNDICPLGEYTSCSANLVATASSKTAYGTQCYTCGCPSGSTLSGNTCVCNNECQTYDVTTKMCTNKADGTVCTNGVCSGGMCINDTCPSGTQKSCAADLVATKTAQTVSGTWCYTCGCPSGAILSGTTCTCTSECQTYDTSTKSCVNKTEGTVCSDGLCKNGSCLNDTCPLGEYTSCSANLVATASSKTAYGTQCYTCGCPSGSTLSGNTCVCNNECQTYNTSTKTCTNKANGTTCTNGLCSNGSCKNDTCPSGTVKTCSANLVATVSSKTAYGTQCYTCGCPSGSTLSGNTCVCNNECQTYNASTKTCVSKTDGTTCSTGLCKTGVCANDTCPTGTAKTCSANLVATASSKTAYGTQCYKCGCPSGATLSGTTCVCSNECQTYNTSTKTCVNKTDGTTCSTGLCKTGVCKNDTCTTGVKTCATNYTKTQVSTTAYGTACYQCCASPKVWNGTACACPSGTPTYANASTCACNSGETNKNGVCTPDLYSPCATYCQTRNSTSSGTFQNCRNTTTTSKLNLVLYLQHTVSANGTKSYTLVSSNTLKTTGANETYTYPLSTGTTYFETVCEYGYATYKGSYYSLEWTKASSSSLCNGLISGSSASCYTSNSKEISNAQKTTCNTFCNTYASRYGW